MDCLVLAGNPLDLRERDSTFDMQAVGGRLELKCLNESKSKDIM